MRTVTCALLLALATAGCVQFPLVHEPAPPPKPAPAAPARPPAPVTADEITDANAHEKATALKAELERDEAHTPAAPPTVAIP